MLLSNVSIFPFSGLSTPFQKLAEMAHKHDALLLVDNSIMSPALSQPLTLGAGYQYAIDAF